MKKSLLLYLMTSLAEEGGEVAQAACKCLKFGVDDRHPKTGNVLNIDLLHVEVNDVIATAEMLGIKRDENLVKKKKERLLKYWEYAKAGSGQFSKEFAPDPKGYSHGGLAKETTCASQLDMIKAAADKMKEPETRLDLIEKQIQEITRILFEKNIL